MLRRHFLHWMTGLLMLAVQPVSADTRDTPPARRVDILVSQNAAPYEESVRGFRKVLEDSGLPMVFEVHRLQGDESRAHAAARSAADRKSSLVYAVGTLALQAARREASGIPVVAGMIMSVTELRGASNATGVALELPLSTELDWLKRLLPDHTSVGVLYSPVYNQSRVEDATRIAAARGLTVYARRVSSPRDLPAELENLASHIEVLWGITDPVILNPQTAQSLLLFSFRNRIPFVGVSRSWVKAGALYALERDFNDIGRQCGEMALSILQGTPAGSLPAASPRKLGYVLNLKTARHMKINLPAKLVRDATEIIE